MRIVTPQSRELTGGSLFCGIDTAIESAKAWGNEVSIVEPFACTAVDEFRKVYEHHSPNGFLFERWCFEQWLYMPTWIDHCGGGTVFKADSDVLIFANVAKVLEDGADITREINPFFHGYINKETALRISDGILDAFRNGTAETQCARTGGHVADMFLIPAIFGLDCRAGHPIRESLFDLNLYETCGEPDFEGHKDIRFVAGQPYWVRNSGDAKMLSIHCWGKAKRRMPAIWEQAKASTRGAPVRLTIGQ